MVNFPVGDEWVLTGFDGFSPEINAEFTENDNSDFASQGGLLRHTFRYPTLAPAGLSNGRSSLTFDRRWDGELRSYLDFNGFSGYVRYPTSFAFGGADSTIEAELWNYDPDVGRAAIFASDDDPDDCFIGVATVDNLGQVFVANNGGYFGGGTETVRTDLPAGNWKVKVLPDFTGATATSAMVWDLDVLGTDLLLGKGLFSLGVDKWEVSNNQTYRLAAENGKAVVRTTDPAATFPAIRPIPAERDVSVELDKQYRFKADYGLGSVGNQAYLTVRREDDDSTLQAFFGATSTVGNLEFSEEFLWTSTYTGAVYIQVQAITTNSVDPRTSYNITFDNVLVEDEGLVFNASGSSTSGSFTKFRTIGYSSANIDGSAVPWVDESFYKGQIANVKISKTNDVDYEINCNIDEGSGTDILNTGKGVDFTAFGTVASDWIYLENTFGGIVLDSVTDGTGTGLDFILRADAGDKIYNVTADVSDYFQVDATFDPVLDVVTVYINGDLITDLSGSNYLSTDPAYCYDSTAKTVKNNLAGTGTQKMVKAAQVLTYPDNGDIFLQQGDFTNNNIWHISGYRGASFVVPRNDTLQVGTTVYFECETPTSITVKRDEDESFVLVNFETSVTFDDVQRGVIVCGNIDSVEGYSAYFAAGYEAGTVNTTEF